MLRIYCNELLRLGKLRARDFHRVRQGERDQDWLQCHDILTAAVAGPKNVKDRRPERLNGPVYQCGVLGEGRFLFVHHRKMPVQITRVFKAAPKAIALLKIPEQCALLGFMAMHLKAKNA